jgi:Domain of unknown function (DUF4263)
MNMFNETSRHLKDLLRYGHLYPDAEADVKFMLKLHTSGEYRLDRYSPIVLIYPFLVKPDSDAGIVLRSLLSGYSGDLFQELALEDAYNNASLYDPVIKSALPYPVSQGSILQARAYLGEPLHSGDLLTALIICPLTWEQYKEDVEKDAEIYRRLLSKQPLPANMISRAHSEIAAFLLDRGISPSQVVMRLKGYGNLPDERNEICSRYTLVIGVLPSGYLKAQVLERWGKHELAESQGIISAPNGLLLPETVLFLRSEIEEFETLLNANPAAPEEAYQDFFEVHPKWLYLLGEQYDNFKSQVRLPPLQIYQELVLTDESVDKMWLKPDFLLKRIGLDLWDVLDIKASDCRMIVGRRSRHKFSEAVSEAVAQLREYSRRIQQNEVRAYVKRQYNMNISEPIAMVLVGRDFNFKTLHSKSMFRTSEGVRIYTYDDLHRLAKHRSLGL